MNEHANAETHGPFRIVRNRDGQKSYFSGHHENGQVRWAEKAADGIHYPNAGLAGTVQRALKAEAGESLNVVRITS